MSLVGRIIYVERRPLAALLLLAAAFLRLGSAADADEGLAGLQLNETLIRGLHQTLPVDKPVAMFRHVFARLGSPATVYPTENYYYFSFTADGRAFSGNFRLSPDARRSGRVHFAYFDASNPAWFRHAYLGPEHGVQVAEVAPLRYEVSHAGRRVTFVLNDLSQAPPQDLRLLPTERFVGRSFDESGLRFLLLYDTAGRNFVWMLDKEGNPPLALTSLTEALVIDVRTWFVFYRDAELDRLVLAGVQQSNVTANNYFDGPFDQLPDNYIEATPFAEYVAEAYPLTQGLLNRRGESLNGDTRLAVTPYLQYAYLQELTMRLDTCKTAARSDRTILYSCLFHDPKRL